MMWVMKKLVLINCLAMLFLNMAAVQGIQQSAGASAAGKEEKNHKASTYAQ